MSEKKGPTVSPNKLAMSRALGAAFLNHQVEQLEKSVASGTTGPASGNWRRQQRPSQSPPRAHGTQAPNAIVNTNGNAKRPPMAPGIKVASRRPGEDSQAARKARGTGRDIGLGVSAGKIQPQSQSQDVRRREKEKEGERVKEEKKEKENMKDADVVVVDASVLVHALYQLKKWCRDGREELSNEPSPRPTKLCPYEALNTLDLLKKGTSHLAQRARAASRVLEAQVGTNPRIRVQQDDAFVLWDKIEFSDNIAGSPAPNTSPEWVRRTICCAQWEVEAVSKGNDANQSKDNHEGVLGNGENGGESQEKKEQKTKEEEKKVILAVLGSAPDSSTSLSMNEHKASSPPAPITPVPLPAPHVHINKHEPRSSGQLVAQWAARANIELLNIEPSSPSDEEGHGHGHGPKSKRRRPSDAHGHSGKSHGHGNGHVYGQGQGALVERPPAVMAMMEVVAQPSRTVRVLARGEKLDPDS
ncbi:hypothetical protein C0989_004258 [Termitomyces sp. Mn162]|nr:hypothetical protein C0989_004258 [Termitomyces sp. Mn162]